MKRSRESIQGTLRSQTRSELAAIARKVGIRGAWRLSKRDLLGQLGKVDPEIVHAHSNPTYWETHSAHVYGIIGVVGVILTLIFAPPLWKAERVFGRLDGIEVRENNLFGFDSRNNGWRHSFSSRITKGIVVQPKPKDRKIVLVGFAGEGEDNSQVKAFDEKGNELWSFVKERNYPYLGSRSGRFQAADLKFFDTSNGALIAVIFNDATWYQSDLIILSLEGKKLKEFWHPGHMQRVEYLKGVFIVMGINNDLRQTSISRDRYKNFFVVFGLKYESIYGAAPPFASLGSMNKDFEWYYVLFPQGASFTSMDLEGKAYRLWTDRNKGFYFDEKGQTPRIALGDGPTSDEVRVVKIGF